MSDNSEILTVRHLSKLYETASGDVTAVKDISFTAYKGEFIAVIGSSGSGKSTLLHLIGGVDSPTDGEIIVDGVKVHEQDNNQMALYRRRKVSVIYQFYNLLPMLNVRDNITLPLRLDGKEPDGKKLSEIMGTLKIRDKEFRYPNQLSGGEQQRTAIARALMTSPAILLADEPTGNLDSANTAEIMRLFRLSNQKFGQTIILVTHDDRVASLTDRIIRIEDGCIASDEAIRV